VPIRSISSPALEAVARGALACPAAMATAAAFPAISAATSAVADEAAAGVTDVEAVVVTGVRGDVSRTVITSPAPIDLIAGPQLNGTGAHGDDSDTTVGKNYLGDGLTVREALDYGFALPNDGFFYLAFDAKHNDPASRSESTTSTIYGFPITAPFDANPLDSLAKRHFYGRSYGPGEEAIYSAAYNAELPIPGGVTLYSFSTFSYRDSKKNTGSFLANNSDFLAQVYPNDIYLNRVGVVNVQTGAGQYGNFSSFGITGGYYYFRLSQAL